MADGPGALPASGAGADHGIDDRVARAGRDEHVKAL